MFIHDQLPCGSFEFSEEFFYALATWRWYDRTQQEAEDAVLFYMAA